MCYVEICKNVMSKAPEMRLIKCKKCNYYNKFGRSTCSYCFAPTSLWNRIWFAPCIFVVCGIVAYVRFFT
jgi:hypothetical protein